VALASGVAALAVIATGVGVYSHHRANRKWGWEMANRAAVTAGFLRSTQSFLSTILEFPEDAGIRPADLRRALRSASEEQRFMAQEAILGAARYLDELLEHLDSMPISSFHATPEHADSIVALVDTTGELLGVIQVNEDPRESGLP
jgi:hypothetical protein